MLSSRHGVALVRIWLSTIMVLAVCLKGEANESVFSEAFHTPSNSAKPWVLWHWVNAAASREGITADLQAMNDARLGGAYLMFIRGPQNPPLYSPPAEQLSPHWWDLVRYTTSEADRLGLQLGMHVCDGFAVAGGPWITPDLSMQQVVWSSITIEGGNAVDTQLAQPTTREGYYRDIAVLAFPVHDDDDTSNTRPVSVTSSTGESLNRLAFPDNGRRFRSADPCSITFTYDEPFVCRSITIRPDGNNYQCHRLSLEVSDDGEVFRPLVQLAPPRHGWQDGDRPVTHSIPPTTARQFRFAFEPEGSEPGSEDLDNAKWSPVLKVQSIGLSSEPRLHHFRGKNGSVWRVSPRTTVEQVPDSDCIPLNHIRNVSNHITENGTLLWQAPPGRWRILRIGHTSAGMRNETGGGGKGLECDKLNPDAVRLQFDRWYAEARRQVGAELASRVLQRLFVDSWECGSQNWTPRFKAEFESRRGYDPTPYLPALAGYPVESADVSERFLYDIRWTVAELLDEAFFATLAELAQRAGCEMTAECVAPTMLSDGMQHYKHVDVPMGEFWLGSPTHDKPNDIRDAISAAHIYGKPVVAAEAFTQLRNAWDEHPALLKSLADRHFAQGINQLVFHVFVQNPWLNRKPGVTLSNIGLYFQRDQVWWPACHAWVDYCHRVQAVLRLGQPVVDIAVFTGEELPRRAVLPERLATSLPGLIGEARLQEERRRFANRGVPLRELPAGVRHAANMADPAGWHDALGGYKYDSINPDALLRLATVRDGRIELPGGASYGLLVIPARRPMNQNADRVSPEVVAKLNELAAAGANILMVEPPTASPSLADFPAGDEEVRAGVEALLERDNVRSGPWQEPSLESIGLLPDFTIEPESADATANIAWAHRATGEVDVYFVANQEDTAQQIQCTFRSTRPAAKLLDPVTGDTMPVATRPTQDGRLAVDLELAPYQSTIIVLNQDDLEAHASGMQTPKLAGTIDGPWQVEFIGTVGEPPQPIALAELADLSLSSINSIRHFAGVAVYRTTFNWNGHDDANRVWLNLGQVANMAAVNVNGKNCGVVWTAPWRVDITKAVAQGDNQLAVSVYGTWRNRLLGDRRLAEDERQTWTTATTPHDNAAFAPFGLLGPVKLFESTFSTTQATP